MVGKEALPTSMERGDYAQWLKFLSFVNARRLVLMFSR